MTIKELEFIDMLFSSIAEDSSLAKEIKSLLLQLQIPVIKASTCDPSFFTSNLHPARKTMTIITKLGEAKNDIKTLSLQLSSITDTLTHKSDITTSDFIQINQNLIALFEAHEKDETILQFEARNLKIKKIKRKEHAKKVVLIEMQDIISNNKVPRLAHDVALKLWPQLMSHRYMHYGKNSTQWNECTLVYRELIASLQPTQNTPSVNLIQEEQALLLQSINTLLNDTDINKSRITSAVNSLRKAFTDILNPSKDKLSIYTIDTRKDSNISQENNFNLAELKLAKLPSTVKVGEWFDLYTGDNHAAQCLKLSVITLDSARLIFVDHRGVKGMEKDAESFAEELSRRLSRRVLTKPSLTDTWNDIISKIPSFR
jgi:hypothetical protein